MHSDWIWCKIRFNQMLPAVPPPELLWPHPRPQKEWKITQGPYSHKKHLGSARGGPISSLKYLFCTELVVHWLTFKPSNYFYFTSLPFFLKNLIIFVLLWLTLVILLSSFNHMLQAAEAGAVSPHCSCSLLENTGGSDFLAWYFSDFPLLPSRPAEKVGKTEMTCSLPNINVSSEDVSFWLWYCQKCDICVVCSTVK